MMGLDGRPTRAIRGDAREDVREGTEGGARDVDREVGARGVSSFSVRGAGEGCARRVDSIRVDSIRFDSIRFIHSFIRRRWIGLDWIR